MNPRSPSFPKVGVVSYSTGNILSIVHALDRIGAEHTVICNPSDLRECDAVIMPGVGHFNTAAQSLRETGLAHEILEQAGSSFPLLGICLGFQLLTHSSDESPHDPGLGFFPTRTIKIDPSDTKQYKTPQIGWNEVFMNQRSVSLLNGVNEESLLFYFANKYGVMPLQSQSCAQSFYIHEDSWVATAEIGTVFGVQFHPEKSGQSGQRVLLNFLGYA
jgi:imidazole glycerol-phosphate synthase subunit HisH